MNYKMRWALIPTLICVLTAFILSFLCLFAGNNKFMQNYDILTVNTSSVGSTLGDSLFEALLPGGDDSTKPEESDESDSIFDHLPNLPFRRGLDDLLQNGQDAINGLINGTSASDLIKGWKDKVGDKLDDYAQALGLDDFYSAHILTYCEGEYTPRAQPNATVNATDIQRNVTKCSNTQEGFQFNLTQIVQDKVTNTTNGLVTLEDLKWPTEIDDVVKTLRDAFRVVIAFYAIVIIFCFLMFMFTLAMFLLDLRGTDTRTKTFTHAGMILGFFLWLSSIIASAITTAVAVMGSNKINEHGNDIGIEAYRGNKFIALTWSTTILTFLVFMYTVFQLFLTKRKNQSWTKSHV